MNLRPRILILTSVLVVASAVAAWWAARQLAEQIVEQWGTHYVEKQVLYDKSRMLQPILREIALSRQLADSQSIKKWARVENDPELLQQAITEMENFRGNFDDKSYFVALKKSRNYYHNNAGNEFDGKQLRYKLDPKAPADRWFFDLIRQQRDIHINVNSDENLGVTKLWIDVLMRDGSDILGVVGTGLDLTRFIQDVVNTPEPGIASLFVDHEGSIQVYRNQNLIDFASITKGVGQHKNIQLLFDNKADQDAIYAAMKKMEIGGDQVVSRFVEVDGKRNLAGIAYLPEIGWYEITLLDLDVLLPLSLFAGIFIVYGLTLLIALIVFNLVFARLVLRPLAQLEGAMESVQKGVYRTDSLPNDVTGEIGRLIHHFKSMATAVIDTRATLETKVRERTEALEQLSNTDPLTHLLNRRGMTDLIEVEINRNSREQKSFGLLWIDVDHFKEINDDHGHHAGDQALVNVSEVIHAIIRPYDSAARWGGDEFLVLIQRCDEGMLRSMGERIREAIFDNRIPVDSEEEAIQVTVSIGATLSGDDLHLEQILRRADQALYQAKDTGRNTLCFDTEVS